MGISQHNMRLFRGSSSTLRHITKQTNKLSLENQRSDKQHYPTQAVRQVKQSISGYGCTDSEKDPELESKNRKELQSYLEQRRQEENKIQEQQLLNDELLKQKRTNLESIDLIKMKPRIRDTNQSSQNSQNSHDHIDEQGIKKLLIRLKNQLQSSQLDTSARDEQFLCELISKFESLSKGLQYQCTRMAIFIVSVSPDLDQTPLSQLTQELGQKLVMKSYLWGDQSSSHKLDILTDLMEAFTESIGKQIKSLRVTVKQVQQSILKQKTLFRSNDTISYSTYLILYLIQSMSLQDDIDFKIIGQVCTKVTEQLIKMAQSGIQDQMLFVNVFSTDLSQRCLTSSGLLELPVSVTLSKCIILTFIHKAYQNMQETQMQNSNDKTDDEGKNVKKQDNRAMSTQIFHVDVLAQFLCNIQQQVIMKRSNQSICYCNKKIKEPKTTNESADGSEVENYQLIQCQKCQVFFHRDCVDEILTDNQDDAQDFQCSAHSGNLSKILSFYKIYQSDYCDFQTSKAFFIQKQLTSTKLTTVQKARLQKKIDQIQRQHIKESGLIDPANKKNKSWVVRGLTMHVEFAKEVATQLTKDEELKDLLTALKESMLSLSYSKHATIRTKALKAIKQVVKLNPQSLLDEQIMKVVRLRLTDNSSVTKESALDLVTQFLTKQPEYREIYLPSILDLASDKSLIVRKKVIHVLSVVLQIDSNEEIIRILVNKWDDSSSAVRTNLLKSLKKVITSKLNCINDEEACKRTIDMLYQLYSYQNQDNLHSILKEVFDEKLLRDYGHDLVKNLIGTMLLSENGSAEFIQSTCVLTIFARLDSKLLQSQICLLVSVIEATQNIECQKNLCTILQCLLSDSVEPDWLTLSMKEKLCRAIKKIVFTCPFVNLLDAIRALHMYSICANSKHIIPQLFLTCLLNLQNSITEETINNFSSIKKQEKFNLSRSILVVSYCTYVGGLGTANNQENESQILQQLQEIFKRLLLADNAIDQELFDVTVEGISYLWLQHPKLMLTKDSCQNILSKITDSFFLNPKYLKDQTKAQVIRTFTKFLSLQQDLEGQIDQSEVYCAMQTHLEKFLIGLFKHHSQPIRRALADMLIMIIDLGLLDFSRSVNMLVDLLSDNQRQTRTQAIDKLTKISMSKLAYIQTSILCSSELIKRSFDYQCRIYKNKYDKITALCQNYDGETDEILQDDKAIYDNLLILVNDESPQIAQQFVNALASCVESFQNENIYLIRFYGAILMTVLKQGFQLKVDIRSAIKAIDQYLASWETLAYKQLKDLESNSSLSQEDLDHQDVKNTISWSMMIYVLKLTQKLCTKFKSSSNSRRSNMGRENAAHTYQSPEHCTTMKALANLYEDIDLFDRKNLVSHLRERLKKLIKSEDEYLKVKIDKQLNLNNKLVSGRDQSIRNLPVITEPLKGNKKRTRKETQLAKKIQGRKKRRMSTTGGKSARSFSPVRSSRSSDHDDQSVPSLDSCSSHDATQQSYYFSSGTEMSSSHDFDSEYSQDQY